MSVDLQSLLSTLDACRLTLGSSRSAAPRLKDLAQIEELVQAVWDDTALLPIEGRFAQRHGGDPVHKATLSLARVIWEHTTDLIAIVGEQGNFLYASPSHHAVLGYMVSYLLSSRLADIGVPREQATLDALLGEAAHSGYALRTIGVRHADGTPRWIETSATRRRVARTTQLILIGRDVTVRLMAEQAERESRERYRQMFEDTAAPLLLIEPDGGTIVDANPAAATFYGYARARLIGMSIGALNTLPPRHLAEALSAAASGSWRFFVFQHRLADGRVRDVEVHVSPITVAGRRLLYSIVHDITDRLLAEAERRATEARLDGILRQVPALVWTTDRDFVIQSAGGAGFAALGIEAHALVGRAISEIVADAELAPALAAHREALTGAQTHYVQALGARRFDIQLQPFRDAAGAIAGCIGVGIECTERLAPALR